MTDQDRRFIEAARLLYGGDAAERAGIVQDIVWHVPGHNPVGWLCLSLRYAANRVAKSSSSWIDLSLSWFCISWLSPKKISTYPAYPGRESTSSSF